MKKAFEPIKLPLNLSNDILIELYKKAIVARNKLVEFSVLLERNLTSENIMWMLSLNESLQSTRIEGTQATFDEVVEAEITNKKNVDILEVRNYLEALNTGSEMLKNIPISTRLILKLHEIILKDGRGKNRGPGEYRKVQNWIGTSKRIEDATYIPPEPQNIEEYIRNLEKYINDEIEEEIDPIIKIAIIHAQFETIHPFLDGNGRVGRILIMLYLLDKKIVNTPTFFVSGELEKNKFKYYQLLNNLRTDGPRWKEWILFFLDAVISQADKNIEKLRKVEELYFKLKDYCIKNNIKEKYLDSIFKNPVFTIKFLSNATNSSYTATSTNVKKLLNSGVIYQDNKMRNKLFYFSDLMDILRN